MGERQILVIGLIKCKMRLKHSFKLPDLLFIRYPMKLLKLGNTLKYQENNEELQRNSHCDIKGCAM